MKEIKIHTLNIQKDMFLFRYVLNLRKRGWSKRGSKTRDTSESHMCFKMPEKVKIAQIACMNYLTHLEKM